ncbi:MAG TPA: HDOD domain-containing protein [Verrucomicrobiae bacterium]|jgi:putative nucleotidyltransferase with HDIG domain|nr:HDOD domain-containing protein [Verrucomicrobiae bacterium]
MTAQEIINKVKNLPPISQAALRLVNLLEQASISNDEIVTVIKCDNVLTAKLLRACNSPYFGLDEPVSSVDQAVLMLGHQQILHIVLTLAFGSAMVVPLPGYAVEANELWRHSLLTATAAEIVAAEAYTMNVDTPVAFTVGLLHDIGKLALSQALTPEIQQEIRQLIEHEGCSRAEAEKKVLGADHGEIGACLLKSWNLPDDIIEAVANHHNPICEPRPRLSVITHLANCLAHLAGSAPGWDGFAVRVSPEAAAALNLDDARLENLVAEVRNAYERVDQFMSMA